MTFMLLSGPLVLLPKTDKNTKNKKKCKDRAKLARDQMQGDRNKVTMTLR